MIPTASSRLPEGIEVLVSDLGKVLLPFDFSPARQWLRENCRMQDAWNRLHELHEQLAFGTGGCSSEVFFQQATTMLDLSASFEEFCQAYCSDFWEDAAVIALVRRAEVGQRVLLSNTNAIHWDWIQERHGAMLGAFNHLVVSHEVGLSKPQPEIYRHVERLTGRPSGTHLLIDDLAENVEGARAYGWDGILFVGANDLEQQLQARYLLPPTSASRAI